MNQAKCDDLLRWFVYIEGRDRPLVTWAESADAARIKAINAGKQVRSVTPAPPLGTVTTLNVEGGVMVVPDKPKPKGKK